MQEAGVWVQATKKGFDQLVRPESLTKIGLCDAFGIALRIFGRPITNSIMLGAFAKTTGLVALKSLQKAMEYAEFRDAALDKNVLAVAQGYENTKVFDGAGKELP
jgi:pyruvate ferredoxin oxidoreductase gamma subunit/phenylglyoxylate dehydrogenase gamma subunit